MSDGPAKKKPIKVHVLRCRGDQCGGLMPFEETNEGFLLGNMIVKADGDGDDRFIICPNCNGRNLVEEVEHDGKWRTRVSGFRAA